MKAIFATLVTCLIFSSCIASAAANCSTFYSTKLSDDQVVSLEQASVQQRMLQFQEVVAFNNCKLVVKDQLDANQSRSRRNQYGLRQSVTGTQKTSLYSCEGTSQNGEFTAYFKVKKFEPIASPVNDMELIYDGCEEFKLGANVSVSVDYSFVNKK